MNDVPSIDDSADWSTCSSSSETSEALGSQDYHHSTRHSISSSTKSLEPEAVDLSTICTTIPPDKTAAAKQYYSLRSNEELNIGCGPVVKFAQYIDGHLEMFRTRTRVLRYYAISHVWGQTRWMRVSCVEGEILVSPEKARFIEEELPKVVGDMPFWMDTLTVNQKNQEEVIATVQVIPEIFRDAEETIAIREQDGLYECCEAVLQDISEPKKMLAILGPHTQEKHENHVMEEAYLQRLWTLQECLLSHRIRFVTNKQDKPKTSTVSYMENHMWTAQQSARIYDSLYILAHAFERRYSENAKQGMMEFFKAYLHQGTIARPRAPLRTFQEDIFSNSFAIMHSYSNRKASEPRDYIFAMMPEFPWYQYPKNAQNMTFNDIFQDLYKIAVQTGHRFTCRITESMVPGSSSDAEASHDWWFPSSKQPDPTCLGDFLKLLGNRSEILDAPISLPSVRVPVSIYGLSPGETPRSTLESIDRSMEFSNEVWGLSNQSGELSKYGAWPEDEIGLDGARKMAMNLSKYPALTKALMLVDVEKEEERRHTDEWQIQQAMKILSLRSRAREALKIGGSHIIEEWNSFVEFMEGKWPVAIQNLLLLLSAMVSCKVPLAAVRWTREHFLPVQVHLGSLKILGLLSKHAISNALWNDSGQSSLCLGRYSSPNRRARDLVLAEPNTEMPIGLVPDFVYENQTKEKQRERLELLGTDWISFDEM